MGKFSSSSARQRPLLFLSLAASLALRVGGVFLPLSSLVAQEVEKDSVVQLFPLMTEVNPSLEFERESGPVMKAKRKDHFQQSTDSLSLSSVREREIHASPYTKLNLETVATRKGQEIVPRKEVGGTIPIVSQKLELCQSQRLRFNLPEGVSYPGDGSGVEGFKIWDVDEGLAIALQKEGHLSFDFDKESLRHQFAALHTQFPQLKIETIEAHKRAFHPSPVPYESRSTLHKPVQPSFHPPEVPHLAMDSSVLSMVEEGFEYTKDVHEGRWSFDLLVPPVDTRILFPKNETVVLRKTIEDLPAIETIQETIALNTQYPNIRALIEKEQLPHEIPTDPPLVFQEIQEVETSMIRSQSKEILEDYDHENGVPSGRLALKKSELKSEVSQEKAYQVNQSNRFTQAFLAEIPPPSSLETVTYANEFDTEAHYMKREDGEGYFFALKMKPKENLTFSSPHQNFIYIIDGSSSIKKHRFGVFKDGVHRCLGYMKEGDSFNILVADAEVIPMSKKSVALNGRSKLQARKFLEERKYRGFFINYNPFDLLEKVSQYLDPEKDNVVVLITDGKGFKNFKTHKEDFQKLAEASKGRFSIYTASASHENNISMLDLLSAFNGGELMYSKTHASFSRCLARMVLHVEHLIAKDIRVHVTDRKLDTGIEFYPNHTTLPSLYSDKAYTIYGTIDQLKDFDLILQGKCGDQWINIKQHISFKHAEKASHSIQRSFALQQAYVCYDYYLKGEDPFFLNEAERILDRCTIPTATR